MQEQVKPLEIALMGYNANLTDRFIRQFAADNEEQVAHFNRARRFLVLTDGTRIKGLSPSAALCGFDGYRFDQLILADDEREQIYIEAAREIEIVREGMVLSCVPEEFQVLYYNVFAPPPCRKCGRPSEVIHGTDNANIGAVPLCRECHDQEHEARKRNEATIQAFIDGLDEVTKRLAEVGITANDAAAAFRRMAEETTRTISAAAEIALIQRNPSLSRFQKWRLVRQIKRRIP